MRTLPRLPVRVAGELGAWACMAPRFPQSLPVGLAAVGQLMVPSQAWLMPAHACMQAAAFSLALRLFNQTAEGSCNWQRVPTHATLALRGRQAELGDKLSAKLSFLLLPVAIQLQSSCDPVANQNCQVGQQVGALHPPSWLFPTCGST